MRISTGMRTSCSLRFDNFWRAVFPESLLTEMKFCDRTEGDTLTWEQHFLRSLWSTRCNLFLLCPPRWRPLFFFFKMHFCIKILVQTLCATAFTVFFPLVTSLISLVFFFLHYVLPPFLFPSSILPYCMRTFSVNLKNKLQGKFC